MSRKNVKSQELGEVHRLKSTIIYIEEYTGGIIVPWISASHLPRDGEVVPRIGLVVGQDSDG